MKRLSRSLQSSLEVLESKIAPAGFIVAAGHGQVAVYGDPDLNGTYDLATDHITPFLNFRGGISVAMGDFNGDGNDELALGQVGVKNAEIRIYAVTGGGRVGALLDAFIPFSGTKHRGVSLAAGNVNSNGAVDLIVGSGPGDLPKVELFADTNNDGRLSDGMVDSFSVFTGAFKGGVQVAAGDVTDDGGSEVIAAQWSGGGTVETYKDTNKDGLVSNDNGGAPLETFQPFGAKYHGGLTVASGQIQNAGGNGAEIIVGNAVGKPKVLIFGDVNNNDLVADDPIFDTLLPATKGLASGAAVAAGDTDSSGTLVEVIAGPNGGSGSHVKIFDDTNDAGALLSDNAITFEFDAIAHGKGGVHLAFGKERSVIASGLPGLRSISDNATTTITFTVAAGSGIIRDLNVGLAINHTFNADLDLTLTHVNTGTSVVLFTDIGNNDHGLFIRLDDQAGTDIAAATDDSNNHAVAGTFRPEGTALLSAFNGQDLGGQWKLTIVDDSVNDVGTLFNWDLIVSL